MSEALIINALAVLFGLVAATLCYLPAATHRTLRLASKRDQEATWLDPAPKLLRFSRLVNGYWIKLVKKRLKSSTHDALMIKLQEAGLSYAITPAEIIVFRWSLVFLVFVAALLVVIGHGQLTASLAATVIALLLLCYSSIDLWLKDTAKRRKQRIQRDFPFFLDVLVLSMKAGLAFPGALQQATAQLPDGPIKHELSRLIREVRTGSNRTEGLQRLAKRIRLPSISNFVAVVAQADESGGSLTKALHEQAKQRRRERFQRAEKLANQAPVKLLFPLVAFLFPVTFIIIGFPLYEQLSGSGFFGTP